MYQGVTELPQRPLTPNKNAFSVNPASLAQLSVCDSVSDGVKADSKQIDRAALKTSTSLCDPTEHVGPSVVWLISTGSAIPELLTGIIVISRDSGLILVCPCIRIRPSWADKTSVLPLFQ